MNPFKTGQAQGSHAGEDQDASVDRHQRKKTAVVIQVAGVGPLVNHAYQEEHPRRRKTVVEHLQDSSVQGDGLSVQAASGC